MISNYTATLMRRTALLPIFTLLLSGCLGIPDNATAVKNFELERYLGTWYEIARLDHRFERGLSNVQANYATREDGGVRVMNRGYNKKKGQWEEAQGKAFFIGEPDVGRLKVSFFGPFYGAYNIVELDMDNYTWSMVIGPDQDYLWILARNPDLDQVIIDRLVEKASALGFATEELIFVEHDSVEQETGSADK